MKPKLFLAILFFSSLNLQAQISLEKVDPGTIWEVAENDFMYLYFNLNSNTVDLHHFNHSHYKSVSIPTGQNQVLEHIGYVTRGLFDCDSSDIEMLLLLRDTTFNYPYNKSILILREDGSIVWQKDSISMGTVTSATYYRTPIFNTPQGAKMYLYNGAKAQSELYALCGTNPMSSSSVEQPTSFINAFPNPARNYVKLSYQLAPGVNHGRLILTDINGNRVQEFQINQNFESILLDTSELAAGTYFYSVQTSTGATTKKLIKVN